MFGFLLLASFLYLRIEDICIGWEFWLLQIQLKSLAEEMSSIEKGLIKVKQELAASEKDGAESEGFCQVHSFSFSICIHTLEVI